MLTSHHERIIQQSAGPIRWMPNSIHRTIVGHSIVIVERDGVVTLDGTTDSRYLMIHQQHEPFTDPVIAEISRKFPYLRSLTDGGIWEGLFSSITAQAVSLHSASAFQRRLCMMHNPAILVDGREMYPLPSAEQIAGSTAEMIKSAGLTTKRAQGLLTVAKELAAGTVPLEYERDGEAWMREITRLPMVGKWTAASTLLWGVGHADVYPPGDAALLRAARLAYDSPSMTMKELEAISENWRPQRAIAARLLWTNLLGPAWDD